MQYHEEINGYVDLSEVDSVVSSVINSFINRARIGKEKYGKTLDRTDLKVSDWINHAQEELMDGILYLEKLKQTSGTILLNHVPSPPDSPPPPLPSPMLNNYKSESVCSSDCACDTHQRNKNLLTNNKSKNIEYQISVLTGELCNIEKNVVKNKSLFESNILFESLKDNATQQGITALILYEVDTVTYESNDLNSWFYDVNVVNKDYNNDKEDNAGF